MRRKILETVMIAIAFTMLGASVPDADAALRESPRYCIDACTGRFCVFEDGTEEKQLCDDGNPRRCVKDFRGILILKQDQYEVCDPTHPVRHRR